MPRASRPSARHRGYDKAHEKWRGRILARDKNCRICGAPGKPSDHADHVLPVRQGGSRFDIANGQRLCRSCHMGPKQAYDKKVEQGLGFDAAGNPLDPNHHWGKL